MPPTPEATEALIQQIGPIRNTHYGLFDLVVISLALTAAGAFYDFTNDLSSKDTAYTAEALEPHTDTTYFTEPIVSHDADARLGADDLGHSSIASSLAHRRQWRTIISCRRLQCSFPIKAAIPSALRRIEHCRSVCACQWERRRQHTTCTTSASLVTLSSEPSSRRRADAIAME